MVNDDIKTIFSLFLMTKSLQQRFSRLWEPSSGSTK